MKAKKIDIELYTDSAFHEQFKVISAGVPADFTDWTFEMVFAADFLSETLLTATLTPGANGIITAHVEAESLEALLPATSGEIMRSLTYVLKAKPAVSYPVRLFYGAATLNRGLPPWL